MDDWDDVNEDVLNDLLIQLNVANAQQLEEIDNNCINLSKFRSTTGVVQNIITICDIFKVNDAVKYTSIELFDKLLVQLVCDTKRVFLETTRNLPQSRTLEWSDVETKLKKQMHLRVVTCVWIASKMLSSKNDTIALTEVQTFLRKSGFKYSFENLNRSERRVLNLLNFKLSVNSVDIYVNTLLAVLKHNVLNFEECLPLFRSVANKLLDLYYMCRYLISRNAFKIITKRLAVELNATEEQLEMERIGANKMLIACGIIGSIPMIIDANAYEDVIKELADISGIDNKLIVDMSRAMLFLICDL